MLAIRDGVMFNRVGDEVVILDLDSGTYYGLDPVGSRLWELISGGASIDDALAAMEREYDVERSVLDRDVNALVVELRERELLVSVSS
jgi:hypothetical protein